MKMQQLLSIALAVMISACTANESLDSLKCESAPSGLYLSVLDTCATVDIQKAEYVAQAFLKKGQLTRATNTEKVIESTSAIKDGNGTPLLYVINYKDNQGFVIVSATQNYMPILAFSNEGHFSLDEVNQSGASIWLDTQKKIISSIDEFPDSLTKKGRAMWIDYNTRKEYVTQTRSDEDVWALISHSIYQWQSEGYAVYRFSEVRDTPLFQDLPIEIKTQVHLAMDDADPHFGGRDNVTFILRKEERPYKAVGPLLQTKWQQRVGFNEFTPNNYPAGCVAVAMGQIMKYNQYPTRYSWSQMDNTYATSITAQFLAEIGANVGMDYGADGSESNIDKALAAFKNNYGYTNAVKRDHSTREVLQELNEGRPVYMRGYDSSGFLGVVHKGHAWVCDGYYSTETYDKIVVAILQDCYGGSESTEMTYLFDNSMPLKSYSFGLHMNWGWGGEHDGYYTDENMWIKDFSGGALNLAHGRKNIIHLYH